MGFELHIITPVSRPQNLVKIAETLISVHPDHWHCIVDPRRVDKLPTINKDLPFPVSILMGQNPGEWGNGLRNEGLERIPADADIWVYFLDDDNAMHPRFREVAEQALNKYPEAKWLIFRQILRNGAVYLSAFTKPIPNCIDIGQNLFHRQLIGKIRFPLEPYNADGYFCQSLSGIITPIHVDEPVCYYNYFRNVESDTYSC